MVTRSNSVCNYALCHIPSGVLYELTAVRRYNGNLNIYSEAWQIMPGLTFMALIGEDIPSALVMADVPKDGPGHSACIGQALNKLAEGLL